MPPQVALSQPCMEGHVAREELPIPLPHYPKSLALSHIWYWTLAFLTGSRWLTQKTLQDGKIITESSGVLASGLQQSACVFIAVVTHHIAQRLPVFLRVGLVEAPLHKHEHEEDNSKPLFGRFVRLHPKVSQT